MNDRRKEGDCPTGSSLRSSDSNNIDNKQKRKRLGRSSRRRKKKMQDCADAAAATEETANKRQTLSSSILAADREQTWPAVEYLRTKLSSVGGDSNNNGKSEGCSWATGYNEKMLKAQLGYMPGNCVAIVKRMWQVPDLQKIKMSEEEGCQPALLDNSNSNQHPLANDNDSDQLPVAIQLYPLVFRNECAGGKPGGQTYKPRRRQPQRNEQQQQKALSTQNTAAIVATNDDDKNNKSSSKCDDRSSQRSQSPSSITATATKAAVVVEPFPTLFWLTHPDLKRAVSRLEVAGWVRRLERRLEAEPDALESMLAAHAAYGKARLQLLTDSDRAYVAKEKPWLEAALDKARGVAGIRKAATIKCLHAHVAHFLADSETAASSKNVVGKWVMQLLTGKYQQQK